MDKETDATECLASAFGSNHLSGFSVVFLAPVAGTKSLTQGSCSVSLFLAGLLVFKIPNGARSDQDSRWGS